MIGVSSDLITKLDKVTHRSYTVTKALQEASVPEWIHLDVVGGLTPSKNGTKKFTKADPHTSI
jgi:hypothetical protein